LTYPNVVLTPHIGANTEDAFFKASQVAAQKLVAFFMDGSTSDTLPPRAPWYGATPFKGE
jgi:D-3-phosphoglycerate dehydrogenase